MKHPSENQIQADFFNWLATYQKRFPELALFYAIPNGANKSPAARGLFQRTGLKSGVPDTHLPLPDALTKTKRGLWIEFKSKKGVVSDTQWQWITMLQLVGHRVEICRSWIEAANITIEYLALPIKPVN